jgi:hypothetical protein
MSKHEPSRTTVVLWRGQYSNDGLERVETLERLTWARDIRLLGTPGDWRIVGSCEMSSDARWSSAA